MNSFKLTAQHHNLDLFHSPVWRSKGKVQTEPAGNPVLDLPALNRLSYGPRTRRFTTKTEMSELEDPGRSEGEATKTKGDCRLGGGPGRCLMLVPTRQSTSSEWG